MNVIINLSEDVTKLFKTMGTVVNGEYYHLPMWFKEIKEGQYEILSEDELPKEVKQFLPKKEEKTEEEE